MLHDILRRLRGPATAERALRAELRQSNAERAYAIDLLRRLLEHERDAWREAQMWLDARHSGGRDD